MSDELNRLRRAFETAQPSTARRAEAVDHALAAFDAEFDADLDGTAEEDAAARQSSDEKNTAMRQGSPRPTRPTDRNQLDGPARAGQARSRRLELMHGLSRRALTLGGTGLAAAIAAVVVIGQNEFWLGSGAPEPIPALRPAEQYASPLDASEAPPPSKAPIEFGDDVASTEEQVLRDTRRRLMEELQSTTRLEQDGRAPSLRTRALEREVARREAEAAQMGALGAASRPASPPAAVQPSSASPPSVEFRNLTPSQSLTLSESVGGLVADLAVDAEQLQSERRSYDRTPADRDRFPEVETSPVKSVVEAPVSTFSIDVDTASYSFLRGGLNMGRLPPANAIRVEELINYFPYDYAGPESAATPFRAHVAVTPTPWNANTKLMHVGIKGYQPTPAERPRSNLVFLIDTSGSMNEPNKLPLLVNSFRLLLGTLDQDDTVSIVTYAGSAGLVLAPTPASERAQIEAALNRLRAGGSTAGAEGLRLAYGAAQENFDAEAINRVILATDGDFNVGFSSPDEMKAFVERQRDSGVFLSVLGFGRGNYHDTLMQALAQNGNGVAAYIDTLSEARKVLADEAGGALIPIAKDVKIQVEFNPEVISEYRLIGYETRALAREDFNDDTVDAGDIGSGHTVTAIYELTPKGSPAELIDPLRYGTAAAPDAAPAPTQAAAAGEIAFLKIRFKRPDEEESTMITRPIDQSDEVAGFDAAPQETRFATAVAAFGQRLRREGRLGDFRYADILEIAAAARGDDPFGYRSEFLSLVRLAEGLDATDANSRDAFRP